ncbi:alcohol dehydrogenase catalytic domain-containing protein [Salinibacterium sp. TMP30]|uniref:zinc-dependent alcohol dehydrogenase n=1 Tax=Salinibacterium sp. TMP30 TaxID=3138237 RepID=UPI003138C3AB
MRALVLREFGKIEVEHREKPVPNSGEMLIRVIATGICGSDFHGYTGENGRRQPGQVMGHETVGRIEAIGDGPQSDLAEGQLVTFNPVVVPESEAAEYLGREQHCANKFVIGVAPTVSAGFADYVVVPGRNVIGLPASMPATHGALVEPIAVAVHAVRRVYRDSMKRVLVVGGGPIGQSLVLALHMHGVRDIYVSEPSIERRDLCERLGATTIDPTVSSVAETLAASGRLADTAFDAVGISRSLDDALNATAFGANVCLVGMGSPHLDLDAFRVSTEERSVVGSFTYSAQDFVDAAAFVGAAPPHIGELVSLEIQPEQADAAFRKLADGDGTPGKILVRFSE